MPPPPQLQNTVSAGFYWDRKTMERFNEPLFLESYGYKVFSQNEEDGIIAEIFKRIGTTNKRFIEFGVQSGLESNTHYLLHNNWNGLWIEGDVAQYEQIIAKFNFVVNNRQLIVHNDYVTRFNINNIFKSHGFTGEIDLLSIDVDGNDYHLLQQVDVINPRVIVIEYNGKFPPECEWIMAYDETYRWNGTDKHGASLKSITMLAQSKGYQLVGTNVIGVNAFFVRKDLTKKLFPFPATAENLFNPLRCHHNIRFQNGHPAAECLKNN